MSGKVKDLQAALFPVQPIPGTTFCSVFLFKQSSHRDALSARVRVHFRVESGIKFIFDFLCLIRINCRELSFFFFSFVKLF